MPPHLLAGDPPSLGQLVDRAARDAQVGGDLVDSHNWEIALVHGNFLAEWRPSTEDPSPADRHCCPLLAKGQPIGTPNEELLRPSGSCALPERNLSVEARRVTLPSNSSHRYSYIEGPEPMLPMLTPCHMEDLECKTWNGSARSLPRFPVVH